MGSQLNTQAVNVGQMRDKQLVQMPQISAPGDRSHRQYQNTKLCPSSPAVYLRSKGGGYLPSQATLCGEVVVASKGRTGATALALALPISNQLKTQAPVELNPLFLTLVRLLLCLVTTDMRGRLRAFHFHSRTHRSRCRFSGFICERFDGIRNQGCGSEV